MMCATHVFTIYYEKKHIFEKTRLNALSDSDINTPLVNNTNIFPFGFSQMWSQYALIV